MDVSGKAGIQYTYGYQGGTIALNAVAQNTVNSDILMSPWDGRTIAPVGAEQLIRICICSFNMQYSYRV